MYRVVYFSGVCETPRSLLHKDHRLRIPNPWGYISARVAKHLCHLIKVTFFPLLETQCPVLLLLLFLNIHTSFCCNIQHVHLYRPVKLYSMYLRESGLKECSVPHHIGVDRRRKERLMLTVKGRKGRRRARGNRLVGRSF